MNRVKRYLGALIIQSLAMVGVAPAIGEVPVDYHTPSWNAPLAPDERVVKWSDARYGDELQSIVSRTPWNDGALESSDIPVREFSTTLGLCRNALETGCISSVQFRKVGELVWSNAMLLKSPGQRKIAEIGTVPRMTSTYEANEALGLFRGVEPNLWDFRGVPHALGTTYFVNVVVKSQVTRTAHSTSPAKIVGIEATVLAGRVNQGSSLNCKYVAVNTEVSSVGEAWTSKPGGYCFEQVQIPDELTVRLSVSFGSRLKELSGWFDARLSEGRVTMDPTARGMLVVEGKPVRVNVMQTENLPADALTWASGSYRFTIAPQSRNGSWYPEDPLDLYSRLSKYIAPRAEGYNSVWRLSSWHGFGYVQNCPNVLGVQGVVFTNASAYQAHVPKFDVGNSTLSFTTASSHLNPDGTMNVGDYKLLVNGAVADCLWGSAINGSAVIAVSDDDGRQEVATTTFSKSDGWAVFSAVGFHYSAATVSVGFRKVPAAKRKTTITCIKKTDHKVTKIMTGLKPSCPSGFAKKS